MLNFLKNSFFINPNKKILNNYKLLLDNVNNLESQIKLLSDFQIKNNQFWRPEVTNQEN